MLVNMEPEINLAVLKVIGVGGCGGNIGNLMIEQDIQGVEFITIDTDAAALDRSKAQTRLQIGSHIKEELSSAVGGYIGQAAAERERERIRQLMQGTDMAFIISGMGGSTGMDAAPVIAQIARELGILTVVAVTMPLACEGSRVDFAKESLDALQEHADSLIVVPNTKLIEVVGGSTPLPEAFGIVNDVMMRAIAGIAEIINVPSLIGVDFADVRHVLTQSGKAMTGSAIAMGPNRARIATEQALASAFGSGIDIASARGALIQIMSSVSLKLSEIDEVLECVQLAADEATVVIGSTFDERMDDELRVTVIMTGL